MSGTKEKYVVDVWSGNHPFFNVRRPGTSPLQTCLTLPTLTCAWAGVSDMLFPFKFRSTDELFIPKPHGTERAARHVARVQPLMAFVGMGRVRQRRSSWTRGA